MTKAELIAAMAAEADVTKAAAAQALEAFTGAVGKELKKNGKLGLEAFTGAVGKELKKNGKLGLVGFGTFSVVKRKAREGRNPQTGKKIKIAAKKVVKFKAGKALADKVK